MIDNQINFRAEVLNDESILLTLPQLGNTPARRLSFPNKKVFAEYIGQSYSDYIGKSGAIVEFDLKMKMYHNDEIPKTELP